MRRILLRRALVLASIAVPANGCRHSATPRADEPAHGGDRAATLLFFSDAHVDLETHPELFWNNDGKSEIAPAGGYARLASVANAVRRQTGGRALLIDGGDTLQGSGPAAWSQGEVVVGPQRALQVDLGIPGNWEVVYGAKRLESWAAALGYPLLAVNVVDAQTGVLVFKPYDVRELGGIRFGFVGLTDPDTGTRQSPSYSRGLRFLPSESVQPYVDELRRRDHVDLVVLITHIGLARSVALAKSLHGVDVLLSGDTHERVYDPIVVNGVWIVEPGSFASFLGRLDVRIPAGQAPRLSWSLRELQADRVPEDPTVKRAVDRALAPYRDRMGRVIGHTRQPLERYGVLETSADDLLTDAIRSGTGVEIALSNGFRFAHPIAAGPITEADLWRLYPIESHIKVGRVTGAQLRAFWERELDHVFSSDPNRLFGGWLPRVSGMSIVFAADAPAGSRVRQILVGGAPLDDQRSYRVAACEREGDPSDTLCRIPAAKDTQVLARDIHDVVREYLGRIKEVVPSKGDRVVAQDLPAHVFSQFYRR